MWARSAWRRPIAWRSRTVMLSPRRPLQDVAYARGGPPRKQRAPMTDPSPARAQAFADQAYANQAQANVASLFTASLAETDPEIADVVRRELGRQRDEIELIASENIVSRAVLEAQGSVLTNKYAEGYPGRRYYGGCVNVDVAEQLAIDRAKALFGAEHANVQPHAGAPANTAVYFAVMKPGDTVLGLNLAHGGHLTHG